MPPEHIIDPTEPLASQIETVEDALLVPMGQPRTQRRPLLGGVLRADGSFVENGHAFIEPGRTATQPPIRHPHDRFGIRPGTWLYGGRHDLRFGHFLVETLARLWALDHIDDKVEGIVFLPQGATNYGRPDRRVERTRALFALVGELPPIEIVVRPARFERLVVPPQGCGSGDHAVGCPEFRQFIRDRFAKDIAPAGAEKIYISRSKLVRTPGQILFEEEIEQALAREGYAIYHPQDHPVAHQIATYRAANKIIGAESSAFHLMAYAVQNKDIGILRRRNGEKADAFLDQMKLFTDKRPQSLGTIVHSFTFPRSDGKANAVLDLPDLAADLRAKGFVSDGFTLPAKSEDEIAQATEALRQRIFKRA